MLQKNPSKSDKGKKGRTSLFFGRFLPTIFVSVIVAATLVGAWVLFQTYRAQKVSRDIASDDIPTLIEIQNIQNAVHQLNQSLQHYQLSLRPEDGREIKKIIASTNDVCDSVKSKFQDRDSAALFQKMKEAITLIDKSFGEMDQSISDMHECRNTLRETTDTFGEYLQETISIQLSLVRKATTPAPHLDSLNVLNRLGVDSRKIGQLTNDAYSLRKPELIQSAIDMCQSVRAQIDEAAKPGRTGRSLTDSRGLTIKDEFAKLEAQMVVYKSNLEQFRIAWIEMEKCLDAVKQASKTLSDASLEMQKITKESASHTSSSSANELLILSVTIFLTLALVIGALIALGIYFVNTIANPLREQGNHLLEKSTSSLENARLLKEAGGDLSLQCQNQAKNLKQTVETIQTVENLASQTSDIASSAAVSAKEGRLKAEAGTEALQQVVNSMQLIENAVERLIKSVHEIKECDMQVANVTKQIDQIAMQTNLLALNAAVEAAHAGEAGLGFAVVADEVRDLSKSVTEAAKKTSGSIQTSISRCEVGMKCSHDVKTSMDEVVQAIQTMRERLHQIIDYSRGVEGSVGEISQAADRQKDSIRLISESIQKVESTTRNTADTAQNTAKSASSMENNANEIALIAHDINELTSIYGSAENKKGLLPPLPDLKNHFSRKHVQLPVKKKPITLSEMPGQILEEARE